MAKVCHPLAELSQELANSNAVTLGKIKKIELYLIQYSNN